MRFNRNDLGYDRIATFDIETTHWDASQGEVVSIGLAVHERGTPLSNAEYKLLHRKPALDEAALIREAYTWLDEIDAGYLVSFNGRDFDFPFCDERLEHLGASIDHPKLHTPQSHLDLLHDDRKALANQRGEKWPSLEEVLVAYGESPEPLMWKGEPLDNTRFGKELGPALLNSVANNDQVTAEKLMTTVEEYLRDDLKKNLRMYYYDIGELEPPVPAND
ncbi:ribonuclease H-like domain-containing protein [Haloferax larsenii]|uniref:Ribonuclease H-like domain-containing protein n=1 Tax=Haloferax larsenii TaxID=302484 RepID=A0ABY5RGU6_HALLR|nr:ribonuclease H-like domain-containing protein [Haloferax larsenii]UVE50775.1 ribonuclease H-like domain-containing protein [Haloferax larsenii]